MLISKYRPTASRLIGVSVAVILVFVAVPSDAQANDLTGMWNSSIGLVYDITQTGGELSWTVDSIQQSASGTVRGDAVNAAWTGSRGEATSATGRIIRDPQGRAVRIEWDNGVVFNRELAHSVHPATPQGGQLVPAPGAVERADLEWDDNVVIGTPPQRNNQADWCWKQRFKQCQEWRDSASGTPPPPMSQECAPHIIFDPCLSNMSVNCAKIPCPKSFKKEIACWECH